MHRSPWNLLGLPLLWTLVFASPAAARDPVQVNLGKRFAIQARGTGQYYKIVDRTTGRSAPLYGQLYDARRSAAVIKGKALDLSGWQIGKVQVRKLNKLGVRVGIHTGAHFGATAFQLTDSKGWRKEGTYYTRTAVLNGKSRRLAFALVKGDNGSRVGSLYVMDSSVGLKKRIADGLRNLAGRLAPTRQPAEPRFRARSPLVYSEAN